MGGRAAKRDPTGKDSKGRRSDAKDAGEEKDGKKTRAEMGFVEDRRKRRVMRQIRWETGGSKDLFGDRTTIGSEM
jgi:hypothetical protein